MKLDLTKKAFIPDFIARRGFITEVRGGVGLCVPETATVLSARGQMVRPVHFVGMSAAAWDIARDIEFAAGCNAPVLLTGERGVGKTLVGQTIHARSQRSSMPLITIDCGTRHEPSFESVLSRKLPDRGTILIKEPGNMSPGVAGRAPQVCRNV